MASYKQPTFQERTALAAQAKQAALDKLRAKPPVDEAVLAERRAREEARNAAQQKARDEKLAARAAEKALKEARKLEAAEAAASAPAPQTEEELKAIRDAKYAARKKRIGKR